MNKLVYSINFICPNCGKESYIEEEELCPTTNTLDKLIVQKKFDGDYIYAEWGPVEYGEGLIDTRKWVCGYCHEEINSSIKSLKYLYMWLKEKGMLQEGDNS